MRRNPQHLAFRNARIAKHARDGLARPGIQAMLVEEFGYSIGASQIGRVLKKAGVPPTPISGVGTTQERNERIASMVAGRADLSLERIADIIGKEYGRRVTRQRIEQIARAAGVPTRTQLGIRAPAPNGRGDRWVNPRTGHVYLRSAGGWIMEARQVLKDAGADPLPYRIHHVDGDKENNSIENIAPGAAPKYTKADLLRALRWLALDTGCSPISDFVIQRCPPSHTLYFRAFGSFSEALRAAGLEPHARGPNPDGSAGGYWIRRDITDAFRTEYGHLLDRYESFTDAAKDNRRA